MYLLIFKRFICPVVLLFLLSSCHKKGAVASSPVGETSAPASSEIKNIIVDPKLDIVTIGGTAINVDSLSITGDVLSVFVNYSGGCKEHNFDLYSNKMYAKSLPPKLTLFLKHVNNDDACRKLITQELKFNISAVKYKGSLSLKVANKFIRYESR